MRFEIRYRLAFEYENVVRHSQNELRACPLTDENQILLSYVSGYFFASSDASGAMVSGDLAEVQTHAWFEAAIPGAGWLALDPTNAVAVGERHVVIGRGRDYDDVPPIRGVYSGSSDASLDSGVEMRRMPDQQNQQVQQQQVQQ